MQIIKDITYAILFVAVYVAHGVFVLWDAFMALLDTLHLTKN